jgi:hypothetical protein
MKEKKEKNEQTFEFSFSGKVTLPLSEVWVDEYAPEDPEPKDVASMVKEEYCSIGFFIDDWDLGKNIEVLISSNGKSKIMKFDKES